MDEDKFYKIDDICELLHVSKITVYRWIKSKKITAYKVGKNYLFKKSDMQYLIEKSRI